jgi:hypothetical protein
MNADDVLFVYNRLQPVDLTGWTFCVITGAEPGRDRDCWPFEPGEIVVLDPSGREPFGEGRKPSKWFVTTEAFPTLADALACRARVLTP